MPPTTRNGLLFDIGTVVHTAYDDEGWLGVRIDGFGEEDAGLGDSELQTPFGFTSRPVDQTAEGGCDATYAHAGNSESFAWFGTDRRYSAKCPPLYQGSSAHWASDGQFLLLDTEKHTTTLYVPRGNLAHVVTVGEDANAQAVINLQHQNGSYVTINDDGVTVRGIGDGFINVNGSKVALNGEVTTTASLTVGGVAGLPVAMAIPLATAITAAAAAFSGGGAPATQTQVQVALTAIALALNTVAKSQMLATV